MGEAGSAAGGDSKKEAGEEEKEREKKEQEGKERENWEIYQKYLEYVTYSKMKVDVS